MRKQAQQRWYELRPEPLTEIDAWLRPYRRLWPESLEYYDAYAERFGPDAATASLPG